MFYDVVHLILISRCCSIQNAKICSKLFGLLLQIDNNIVVNSYRTCLLDMIQPEMVNKHIKLAGWIHSKRDHGDLIFIDLRDSSGLKIQCIARQSEILEQT